RRVSHSGPLALTLVLRSGGPSLSCGFIACGSVPDLAVSPRVQCGPGPGGAPPHPVRHIGATGRRRVGLFQGVHVERACTCDGCEVARSGGSEGGRQVAVVVGESEYRGDSLTSSSGCGAVLTYAAVAILGDSQGQ